MIDTSREFEVEVIGHVLFYPPTLDDFAGLITPADFGDARIGTYFAAALALASRGIEPNLSTLLHEVNPGGVAPDTDWTFLATGRDGIGTSQGAMHAAEAVAGHAKLRRLAAAASEIAAMARSGEWHDAAGVVGRAESRLCEINGRESGVESHTFRSAAVQWFDDLKARVASRGAPGVRTGLTDLDSKLLAFSPGHVYVVGASSGHGKTALCVHFAISAMRGAASVVYVTLEVPAADIIARAVASLGRVGLHEMRDGHADAVPRAADGLGAAMRGPTNLHITDASRIGVAGIEREVRRAARKNGPPTLVVVDYVQLVRPAGKHRSREEAVAEVVDDLRALAKRQKCAVVVAAQLNRERDKRADKRPIASDLRESASLEHAATGVMLLHRPALYDPSLPESLAEIHVVKHRLGPVGVVPVYCDLATNTFADLDRRHT